MYLPKQFAESDQTRLVQLIQQYPLGCWTAWTGNKLVVNHIPFLFDPNKGTHGSLSGHLARANPVWKNLEEEQASVVVFQGAQAYITPNWYPSKKIDGKVVPTWNYTVVHLHGSARIIDEDEWLLEHVNQLTNSQESLRQQAWQVSDAPEDFIQSQLVGIVGVEITVTAVEGKWKVSQNRSIDDRSGVVDGLNANGDGQAVAMADLVRGTLEPTEG